MTVDPETQAVVDEALAALTAFMDAELAGRPAPERDRLGRHAAQQLGAAHDADWLLMADTLTNAAADKIRALHPGPGWGALPIACTRDGTRINPPEHSPLTWAVRAVTARINDDAGYIDHLRLPAGDDQVEQLLTTLCSIYGQIYATAIRAGGGGSGEHLPIVRR